MAEQPHPAEPPRRRRRFTLDIEQTRTAIGAVETGLYLVVGVLLVVAAAFILADTVKGIVNGLAEGRAIVEVGLRVLDRVLLFLIIAELLYTLRLVTARGEIFAEPFLFIGLIAVVRRVVVITAEVEKLPLGGRALTNFLLELGLLAVLALAFGLSIYLLRHGAAAERTSMRPDVPAPPPS